MANYVNVPIVCPCGRLWQNRRNNSESRSTTRGTFHCSACNRNVEYAVCGSDAYTNYK